MPMVQYLTEATFNYIFHWSMRISVVKYRIHRNSVALRSHSKTKIVKIWSL